MQYNTDRHCGISCYEKSADGYYTMLPAGFSFWVDYFDWVLASVKHICYQYAFANLLVNYVYSYREPNIGGLLQVALMFFQFVPNEDDL